MSGGRGDVAIIGMACLFPQAPDLKTFWENIVAGVDAIGEPPDGWGAGAVLDPDSTENDRLYTTRGGYLGGGIPFDPMKFGVMPRAVDGGEPEHFVALQLAHQALEDAGYLERPFDRSRTGVILGRGTYVNRGLVACFQHTIVVDQVIGLLRRLHPEYSADDLALLKKNLKANLPPFNPETAPGLAHSVMCGRIANRLNLMGPAFSVDAACSSALIAVDYAIRDLRSGVCDLVLAGGIQVSTTHPIALLFSQLGALARSGTIRPFHPEADGLLLGEGAGVVVLKRRDEAERDGDRIYAVIRSVGTSSDGRAVGILAPRVEGEELAMRRAYESSGVDPASVGLIEAHGTGTPVGDATEIEAMLRVFGDGGARARIAVGSVKSMIGHCIPGAAVAGLIKAALAVYHGILPPTLHADGGHPKLSGTPLYLNPKTRPWIHHGHGPRRAGVSAFGFGGINAHAILEEHGAVGAAPRAARLHARRDSELFLISASSRAALAARCESLRTLVARNPAIAPHDLAYSLNCPAPAAGRAEDGGPGTGAAVLSIVAGSLDDLGRKLDHAIPRLRDAERGRIKDVGGIYYFDERLHREGGPAFLFPGEGAQYPDMLADLCLHFPEARAWFDLMDRAFRDHERGFLPSEVLFPPPGAGADEAESRIWSMESAIESVFAADQALHAILTGLGVRPAAIAGHSTGEYSALLASGATEVADESRLIEHILDGNRATESAARSGAVPRGVLLAVGPAEPEILRETVERSGGALHLAMDNCPHQAVLCGDDESVSRAQRDLKEAGAVCQRLPFERAYHTPLFRPVCEELRGFYERATFRSPRVPLYSCAIAARVPDDPAEIRRLALAQWALPVRFRETIEAMYDDGIRIFIEVGPRGNLTSFVDDTLRGRPHLAIASNVRSRPGVTQLHHLLGLLAAHGAPLRLNPLYENRGARRIEEGALWAGAAPRKTAASGRTATVSLALPSLIVDDDVAARTRRAGAASPAVAASPPAGAIAAAPARAVAGRPAFAPSGAAAPDDTERDGAMRAYLATMNRFLADQEDVVRAALGRAARPGDPIPAPPPVPEIRVPARSPEAPAEFPFLGRIGRPGADGTVRTRVTLSIDEAIVLRSHTLGGRISSREDLRALPVLPLALGLEIMAEAAAAVRPGGEVVGMRSIRARRWLAFTRPRVTIELTARPAGAAAPDDIEVSVTESGDGGPETHGAPVLAATVRIGRRPSGAAAEGEFPIRGARAPRWRPEELYAEGMTHGMFHGAPLRGVRSIERVGEDGLEGTLAGLPKRGLFLSDPAPRFCIDPILLDAAGQLVGFWTADVLPDAFVVFPVEVDRVEFFAPRLAEGDGARGTVRIRGVDEARVIADLEVSDGTGRLLLRASGWTDRRFRMPEAFYAFRLDPSGKCASVPWDAPLSDPRLERVAVCRRLDRPDGFGANDTEFWRQGLAWLALDEEERETWLGLRAADERRTMWLMGRLALKDAVRALIKERHGLSLYPADIAIIPDPRGGISARLRGVEGIPAPAISLSHTDGVAAAIASSSGAAGIDIERLRALDPAFERAALTAAERSLLDASAGGARPEWLLRMWCAKEAAGKALGTGLDGGPARFAIESIDPRNGTLAVRRMGTPGEPGRGDGEMLHTHTGRDGDLVYATAIHRGEGG